MSVGSSLNSLEIKIEDLESVLRDIDLALYSKTSKDDFHVQAALRRLHRIDNAVSRLGRELERILDHEQHRQFTVKKSKMPEFSKRSSLLAHQRRIQKLKDRLMALPEQARRLADKADAPTTTDNLSWAADQLGIRPDEITASVVSDSNSDMEFPSPQPGGGVLTAIAAVLMVVRKIQIVLERASRDE